ncbi:TonB-dependent receptor, partial [Acinetobacter baumannii]|nr:TonB-dependent receptor [Acinetobacter baumannii]
LNLHHYEGRGEMPEGLTQAQYAENPYQSSGEKNYFAGRRTDVSLRYNHKDEKNNFEVLSYYIDSFRTSNLETTLANGQKRLDSAPRDYKVYAIEPRYSRIYQLGNTQNEVTVGYRYLKEESSEFAGRTASYAAGSSVPDFAPRSSSEGGTKAHAVYIDNRMELGRWTITPGVRFESIETHNNFTGYNKGQANTVYPKIDSDEFLPSLSVMYSANENWNIFANAGVSFGPQQYSQLARLEGTTATATTDGLHPEKSNNYEIGTKYLGNGLNAEFTVFYLDFDKELSLVRDAG